MSDHLTPLHIPVEQGGKPQFSTPVHNWTNRNCSTYPKRSYDWSVDDIIDQHNPNMYTHIIPQHKRFPSVTTSRMKYEDDNDDVWYDDVRRRFDERRKQWDEDVKRMHQEFFGSPHKVLTLPRCSFSTPTPHTINQMTDTFHSQFERAPDGQVNFVAHFDVPEYDPQSVKVSVRDRQLFVNAKTEQRSTNTSTSREYTRSINLPTGALEEQINAVLSANGVLVVTCPMRPPPFPSSDGPYLSSDSQNSGMENTYSSMSPSEGIYPKSAKFSTAAGHPQHTLVEPSRSLISQSSHSDYGGSSRSSSRRPKFRLELPIDSEYAPEEIRIKTLNQRIYVNARHEERTLNRTAVREFSKEYDIPDNVDPESLEAKLDCGILYIEASPKADHM